jgi:hypothetical protein
MNIAAELLPAYRQAGLPAGRQVHSYFSLVANYNQKNGRFAINWILD